MLGLGAMPHFILNGEVTKAIPLTKSLRQGCPLSPLIFVLAGQKKANGKAMSDRINK